MILHLIPKTEWEQLPADAPYAPASIAKEGFIHCSTDVSQMLTVANAFYKGVQGDVLLLEIDEAKLSSELKWEAPAHPEPIKPTPSDVAPPEAKAEFGDVLSESVVQPTVDSPAAETPAAAKPADDAKFPHIYGPLNRDAVVNIRVFTRDAAGVFTGVADLPAAAPQDPNNPLNIKSPSQMANELLDATDGFSEALKRMKDKVETRMDRLDDEIKKKLP
jgi:uncharacterized protein (DUF952 family)